MNEIALSIIVPVYNVEKYIEKCILSIRSQLNSKVELIIVDDKTPDKSIDICNRLLHKVDHVKIVKRENNGGLSRARNSGIEVANGKFCWFIDSDDYIETGSIGIILDIIYNQTVDLIQFNHKRINEWGGVEYASNIQPKIKDLHIPEEKLNDMCVYLSNEKDEGYEVWRRIYSLDLIRKYQLRFEPNKEIFAEDICFNLYYANYCNRTISIDDCLYYYLLRNDSIMGKQKKAKFHEMQCLAYRAYLYSPILYIKENFYLLYAGIMQLPYNIMSFEEVDEYNSTVRNTGFVVEMNTAIVRNIYIDFFKFRKRTTVLHFLYASYQLALFQRKQIIRYLNRILIKLFMNK